MRMLPTRSSVLLLAVAAAACRDPEAAAPSPAVRPASAERLPPALVVGKTPGLARGLAAVKAGAREGDDVIVRARIGGGTDPFVAGVAAMSIADEKLVPCSEMSMEDGCETPWDYCCASVDDRTAGMATVQVVGKDGKVLRADLRDAGLTALSTVVVKGRVGPRPDPKVLVIDAEAIFVEKASDWKPK